MLRHTSGNFAAREKRTAMTTSAWAVPDASRRDFQLLQTNANPQKTLTHRKNQPTTISLDGNGMFLDDSEN
jgi:hypothetical protein